MAMKGLNDNLTIRYPLNQPWQALLNNIGSGDNGISFSQAIELFLYHPEHGYYQKNQPRVGKSPTTDFYTATSLGPIFGKMVLESTHSWLQKNTLSIDTFCEIGAEKNHSLYDILDREAPHYTSPYKKHHTLTLNNDFSSLDNKTPILAFSNELLDAQPFNRYRFINQSWAEWGLFWNTQELYEGPLTHSPHHIPNNWPNDLAEGYTIDWPSGAEKCLTQIAEQPQIEAIVFFDYGKYTPDLFENYPEGTARAYHQHQQTNALWQNLGSQDITHHIAWDPLISILQKLQFTHIAVLSQEAFFMEYGNECIARLFQNYPHPLHPYRRGLQALLHPAHFGQKFQVLMGIRKIFNP